MDNVDLMDKAADSNYEVYLNPELNSFKSLDNLVSDNYNTATIGLPFYIQLKEPLQAMKLPL